MSEKETTTKVVETKTVVPSYDILALEQHLCCPNQFYHILEVLPTLSKSNIRKLRDDLRSRTGNNRMHFTLEHKFRVALGEE